MDEECGCMTCRRYSRAFLHNLVAKGLPFAAHLMSYHNVAYTQALTKRIREAIRAQRFPEFAHDFVRQHYPKVCAEPDRICVAAVVDGCVAFLTSGMLVCC